MTFLLGNALPSFEACAGIGPSPTTRPAIKKAGQLIRNQSHGETQAPPRTGSQQRGCPQAGARGRRIESFIWMATSNLLRLRSTIFVDLR
jgi:hypothetical protein